LVLLLGLLALTLAVRGGAPKEEAVEKRIGSFPIKRNAASGFAGWLSLSGLFLLRCHCRIFLIRNYYLLDPFPWSS